MNRFTAERSAAMRFLAQSAGSGSEAPEQELSAPSSVLVEQAEPVQPSIDYKELLQRVRHNESLMRRMLIVFLDDAPRVMRRLDVSLAAEDLDDVADIAHSVVNMTGAIRAHGAADVAKRLEMAASEADLDRSKNLAEELAAEMDRVVASISEAYPEATPVAGADQDAAAGSG
jgi:HPt (histidine-containing phosphotransfer) domain-containing protein